MTLAQERFSNWQNQAGSDLEKRRTAIEQMVKPVDEQLKSLKSIMHQMKGTDEALRHDLKNLQSETSRIAGAMHNPKQRGQWGEYILDRLLEKSGLVKGVHYHTQVSVTAADGRMQRPDVIIKMQEGLHIIVDSKAPIHEFLDDLDEPATADAARQKLVQQVRNHIRDLSKKDYAHQQENPDFVVLFLPGENLYSIVLSEDPSLIDFAAENNIVLSSPMLMLALARVVHMGWRQSELGQHAREIASQGEELHKRITSFMGSFTDIGKALKTSVDKYNKAVNSMDRRVMPQIRRLEEMQVVQPGQELPDPAELEVLPKTGSDQT